MKIEKVIIALVLFTILFSCGGSNKTGTMLDVDGNSYKTVEIDKLEWMAENLDVSHFANGEIIPQAQSQEEWIKACEEAKPAWCYYNEKRFLDKENKLNTEFGKLYNSYAVMDKRGLAPEGWYIPTNNNWNEMINYLGGIEKAGAKMKNSISWAQNGNGNNSSGFTGIAGGWRVKNEFGLIGIYGTWWALMGAAYSLKSENDAVTVMSILNASPYDGCSVRCIRPIQ